MQRQHPVELTAPSSILQSLVPRAAAPSLEYTLVRPDDQLRLRFALMNGRIDRDTNTIVELLGEEPIYYAVDFGPQHVVEDPIATGATPPLAARKSRVAADSRIVVEIPDGTPFTVATLLDLASYALLLDERAHGDVDDTNGEEPTAEVTAIENPASLVISPTSDGRFVAEPQPITRGDITELWRARLARVENGSAMEPPLATTVVRAIWSRSEDPDFFLSRPVVATDRDNLVSQSTLTKLGSVPIPVRQLWLTSQGAFLDADGAWTEAGALLTAYRHRVVTGRDLRVEVVERGYLAPFGHRASITTLTERAFIADADGMSTASLTSDEFIAITSPTVKFPAPYMPSDGRRMPFSSMSAVDPGGGPVGLRRVVMPNGASINRTKAHIVTRNGEDVRIAYVATDRSGKGDIAFDLPVVFVADSEAYGVGQPSVPERLARWYANDANADFATAELNSQQFAWAEPAAAGDERGRTGSV